MEKEVLEEIERFNGYTKVLVKKSVATVVAKYGTQLIHLEYGDKTFEFNPEGFNMLYINQQLYNNEVVDALME